MVYELYTDVYDAVDDPSTDSIISWGKKNNSFVIRNPKELMDRNILGKYHRGNMPRLIRMLKNCGFRKVRGSRKLDLKFGHGKYFKRGHPELLEKLQLDVPERKIRKYREGKAKEAADCLQNLQL